MSIKPLFTFRFHGLVGQVYPGDFVCWNGIGVHIESVGPEMRTVIERAAKRTK